MNLLVVFLIGLILYLILKVYKFWIASVVLSMWIYENNFKTPSEKDMLRLTQESLKNLFKYGW